MLCALSCASCSSDNDATGVGACAALLAMREPVTTTCSVEVCRPPASAGLACITTCVAPVASSAAEARPKAGAAGSPAESGWAAATPACGNVPTASPQASMMRRLDFMFCPYQHPTSGWGGGGGAGGAAPPT